MTKDNSINNTSSTTLQMDSTFKRHTAYLGRVIASYHNLYQQESTFSDGEKVQSYPHLIGYKEGEVRVVAYDDSRGPDQLSLVKAMGERQIAISIKHHAQSPSNDHLEIMKLQCTHAQLVVRSGNKVITLNNPQNYQSGLFGDTSYPMIFFTPSFPEQLSREEIIDCEKNIIAWSALINTFSHFPGDYNGGDPLTAKSLQEAHLFGKKVLDAFAGKTEAIQWLEQEDNKLYCAEMVFLALTLGTTFPLNEQFLAPDVLNSLREAFLDKKLSSLNSNPQLSEINIELPRFSFQPFKQASEEIVKNGFGDGLAIQPMLVTDMITSFIKYSVPRKDRGEKCGKYQVELLQHSKLFLKQFLPHQEIQDPNSKINILIKKLEVVLMVEYESYEVFQASLKDTLFEIEEEVAIISTASNMFIPPHTFLVRALEKKTENKVKGLLGIDYLGHGIHQSLVNEGV